MTDKLSIYNGALLFCKERKIAALTTETESRRLLDDVWDRGGVNTALELGQWNFAMRSAKLEYAPSITPAFGYNRAFERPSDFVRLSMLCSDEFFSAPLLHYRDEGGYWFAELDEIYVSYVSDDSAYGKDYSLWPPSFTRFVEGYFGSQIIGKLTASESKEKNTLLKYEKVKKKALSIDAMNDPTKFVPPGRWSLARTYGRGRRDMGNRGQLLG